MPTLTIVGRLVGLIIILLFKKNAALKNDVYSGTILHRQETKRSTPTQCASPQPLGMESNLIPDSAITASSWLNYNTVYYGPQLARLNNKQGTWVKHENDAISWIQVDLGGQGVITGLQTQGAKGSDKAVKSFKVKTGTDLCGMDYIKQNGIPMVFTAASHVITTHNFPNALPAQYIRIEPTACGEYCALRFEVLGCLVIDRCASDWVEFDSACYLLHHHVGINYTTATTWCTNQNAHLAHINSQKEQEFLKGILRKYQKSGNGYYIGLTDVATEGTFVWSDRTPLAYSRWASKEPQYAADKDCAVMKLKNKGKWKCVSCSDLNGCICERRRQVNPRSVLQPAVAVCNNPVRFGLESHQLPSSRITASTRWSTDKRYHWSNARLNTKNSWVADPSDINPWIQVDLYGSTNVVTGVITQGAYHDEHWITAFKVRVGTKECDLRYITENSNSPKVFGGNSDQNTENKYLFPNPVQARFVRIEPIKCHDACALRLEVVGCNFSPQPMECYTDSTEGKDYRGYVSVTINDRICQKWTYKWPHSHSKTPANYPGKGLGDHNYCRNPDGDPNGVYCYTNDLSTDREYCNIGLRSLTCAIECYTEVPGAADYQGQVSITKSGRTCQKWTSMSPHLHTMTPARYPGKGLGDHNYCRNPDDDINGVWCYTTDKDTRYEACNIAGRKDSCAIECYTDNPEGKDYRGHVPVTKTGKTCQMWTSQSPHTHTMTPANYPDKGLGNHSYCRNPDGRTGGAWCYTTDVNTIWELCNIGEPKLSCAEECYTNHTDYRGYVTVTRTDKTCQKWTSQTPHTHSMTPANFPGEGLGNHNYCRNPNGRPGGAWCYTTIYAITWEYCNIGTAKIFCGT